MERTIPSFEETERQYAKLLGVLSAARNRKRRHIYMTARLRIADTLMAEASQPLTPEDFESRVTEEVKRIQKGPEKPVQVPGFCGTEYLPVRS